MDEFEILLVEDEQPLAMGIEYALKKQGYSVIWAKKLSEAGKFFSNATGLILLDIMLPDGSGYDFCVEVRKKSSVPIIFMTAMDDEANVVYGLDIGGDDYISKPIRISELISRINAVTRRAKVITGTSSEPAVFNSGTVMVDPLKCEVKIGDEIVFLTAIEYKLLLMLIENREHVLERNRIIEKLWGVDCSFVDDNTLNVYMKRLREKIEFTGERHIETVRGIGYVWKDGE